MSSNPCEIGDVKDCTICKLCASKCPTEIDLEKVVRVARYLDEPKGSHRGVFLTMSNIMTRSDGAEWLKKEELDIGGDEKTVYFPGCSMPMFDVMLERGSNYSGAAYAGIKVLNQLGISPQITYGCCGHDLYYSGRLDEFELMKEKLLEKIGDAHVITGCAECYHMLKNVYGVDVEHFSELVSKNMDKLEPKDLGVSTTYHDPCRLGRYNQIYDAPREILEKISNYKEMEHNKEEALCCGISAWLNCNAEAKELRKKRIGEALDAGADTMVISCPKCRVHLDCIYYEENYEEEKPVEPIKILDLQELVAQSLGLYDPSSEEKSYVVPEGGGEAVQRLDIEKDPMRYIDDNVVGETYKCTTCFACAASCPTDFEIPHMMERFRRHLVELELNPPAHKTIYDRIMATGNPFGEEEVIGDDNEDYEIVYFPGCTAQYRFKNTMEATKKIFDVLGVKYTCPKDAVCCGSVLFRTGYDPTPVVEKNTKLLKGKKVVVSCAGCYATFARDYEGIDVVHLVDFLQDKMDKLGLKSLDKKVTYHDPCHLGREFQKFDEARSVIHDVPGTELIEFKETRNDALCCGGGGGLRSHDKEFSQSLAAKRIDQAMELDVDTLLSTCPFCELNLNTAAKEKGVELKVMDIAEYLIDALE